MFETEHEKRTFLPDPKVFVNKNKFLELYVFLEFEPIKKVLF